MRCISPNYRIESVRDLEEDHDKKDMLAWASGHVRDRDRLRAAERDLDAAVGRAAFSSADGSRGRRLHRPRRWSGATDSGERRGRHRFHRGSISSADWDKLSGGGQVLILKSGETITGQLVDIGGSSPLRMTFRTPSGERDFSSNDIARIVMSRPDNAAATSGTAASSGAATGPGIAVPSQQQWTPTGVTVRRGDWVSFNASGEIHIGGGG